ncbi:ubiquitin-conjugating enzyme/RWD-like protein [Xylaria sp. FL0043]|nr:ubiquitin-conjugating enzyme/RWD-like protein [Xylaria sp. FL0043]
MASTSASPSPSPSASTSVVHQRLMYEMEILTEPKPIYEVFVDDNDLQNFVAFLYGPNRSRYKNTVLGFRFEVPDNYPEEPPRVTFLQYGHKDVRIHPNFHPDGTVNLRCLQHGWMPDCWRPEKGIHYILLAIRTQLDDLPHLWDVQRMGENLYQYNTFVQHMSWHLLIDYLNHERDEDIVTWLKDYIAERAEGIMHAIYVERRANRSLTSFCNPYAEPGVVYRPDYDDLIEQMGAAIAFAQTPHEHMDMDPR